MHGDGFDRVGALIECVDEADIAVPAQAEHVRHLLAHEIIDDDLAAIEHISGHGTQHRLTRLML